MKNKKTESQEKMESRLYKMIKEDGPTFWQALFQVTGFYQHFGFCECGRVPITLIVQKSHFMYCKKCNAYWDVGFNLFGHWRYEDESVLKKNEKLLSKARPIKPKHLFVSSGQLALMTHEEYEEIEEAQAHIQALEWQEHSRGGDEPLPF